MFNDWKWRIRIYGTNTYSDLGTFNVNNGEVPVVNLPSDINTELLHIRGMFPKSDGFGYNVRSGKIVVNKSNEVFTSYEPITRVYEPSEYATIDNIIDILKCKYVLIYNIDYDRPFCTPAYAQLVGVESVDTDLIKDCGKFVKFKTRRYNG